MLSCILKLSTKILLALLSGIMLALSFPPMPFGLLAFAAFVPLLYLFSDEKNPKFTFLLLYITFFVFHTGSNWWISSWQEKTDPFLFASGLALDIAHPFFFMVPFVVFFILKKRLGFNISLKLFPAIWVGFEWLHGLGDMGYPWLTVGYTQIYNRYFVQIADVAGIWGVSFIIVTINIIILRLIIQYKSNRILSGKEYLRTLNFRKGIIYIFLLLMIPIIYGFFRINEFDHSKLLKEKKTVNVGIIQPNIDPWDKWSSGVVQMIRLHQKMTEDLISSKGKPDIIVWSETAIPFVGINFNTGKDLSYLETWIDSAGISLLTGIAQFYVYPDPKTAPPFAKNLYGDSTLKFQTYNAALMLNPKLQNELNPQFYQKMKLTPFAERIPWEEQLTFLKSLIEWNVGISSWSIGKEQKILVMQNHGKNAKIGTIICIESIHPGFVKNFAAKGAELLTIITNDGWYDFTSGPEQHYAIAEMRAIESRRYIARCANTGVSGFISATGESLLRAQQYKPETIELTLPLITERTLYSYIGDILPELSTLCVLIFLVNSFVVTKRRKKLNI
jgi:apolipoprotein N-acyltransferase